ncbi:MAG: hypothetical protein HQ530_02960 [Parcubacteria group bacterium]|nr:hypothetical protein [Parcubacteria group bacterium]
MKNVTSVLFLIGANCIPLVGTIFLGWDILTVLFVYWLETIVMGFFSALKLFISSGKSGVMIYGAIIFTITYPIWVYVYLKAIQAMAVVIQGEEAAITGTSLIEEITFLLANFSGSIILALLSLFISHAFSFGTNFLRQKEYKTHQHQTFSDLMYAPYKRIVTMHIVLFAGSFLAVIFSAPHFFVVVLVILKILVDLLAHLVEHGMISRARLAQSSWLVLFGAPKH